MSHALQSLLDQSFHVSRYLSGKYHTLFIVWSFSIMLYHLLSHPMSYAPILTHPQTNSFPMTTLSLHDALPISLFPSCDPFLLCFIILSLTICHMPLFLLIFGLILSHDDVFPLSLLIHSFSWPTSSPNDLTNRSHLPSCLCFLLLFYLWFERLWSSVTATVLVLKLY